MKNYDVFLLAYNATNKSEGKYANNPKDRGGETFNGISRVHNPIWTGWKIIDDHKKKANFPNNLYSGNAKTELLKAHQQLFYNNYWKSLYLHNFPVGSNDDHKIYIKLYDISVLMGIKPASVFLQRALNVLNRNEKDYKDIDSDGKIGNKTLKAFLLCKNKSALFKILNSLQANRLIELAERDKTQEVFVNGWFDNRIAKALEVDNNNNIA